MITVATHVSQTEMVMVFSAMLTVLSLGTVSVIAGVDRCPPGSGSGGSAKFSLAEQGALLAPWVVFKCLDGNSFSAGLAYREIPEFAAVYKGANGVGDALGNGHKSHPDTLGLYAVPGRSPKVYQPMFENAVLAWNRCTEAQQQVIANDLGVTVEGVEDRIRTLASFKPVESLLTTTLPKSLPVSDETGSIDA